ncbi:MAG: hypothetical protein WD988_02815 [Candidatus Curtissbacteria bacterium]
MERSPLRLLLIRDREKRAALETEETLRREVAVLDAQIFQNPLDVSIGLRTFRSDWQGLMPAVSNYLGGEDLRLDNLTIDKLNTRGGDRQIRMYLFGDETHAWLSLNFSIDGKRVPSLETQRSDGEIEKRQRYDGKKNQHLRLSMIVQALAFFVAERETSQGASVDAL